MCGLSLMCRNTLTHSKMTVFCTVWKVRNITYRNRDVFSFPFAWPRSQTYDWSRSPSRPIRCLESRSDHKVFGQTMAECRLLVISTGMLVLLLNKNNMFLFGHFLLRLRLPPHTVKCVQATANWSACKAPGKLLSNYTRWLESGLTSLTLVQPRLYLLSFFRYQWSNTVKRDN